MLKQQSVAPSIDIVRATADNWSELAEFYSQQFGERLRLNDARVWKWEFLDQPDSSHTVPFFLLRVDGRIEGAIGYFQFDLCVGDAHVGAMHPINYFVNPRYKGLPALRLFRVVLLEGRVVIGSYISNDARRLLNKSGFVDLAANVRAYHLGLKATARSTLRSSLIRLGRRAWESVLRRYLKYSLPTVTYRFDHELNDKLAAIAGAWLPPGIGIRKTADHLQWRYARSPILNCRYLWQFADNIPVGLAVMHFDPREQTAVLLDVTAASFELNRCVGIVLEAIRQARANSMSLFTTHCMSPVLEKALRRVGCGCVNSDLGFMVYSPDAEKKEVLSDVKRWHFMIGDTDRY